MSLVTPIPQQTLIRLYGSIGWDNRYVDVRWFSSESERTLYLNNVLVSTFTNCSVVKPGKSIRLQGRINDFIHCTYLSFVNTGVGTDAHTFYAFITSVDYVNVNTIEIAYEIDWIQSYMFDFIIESCFVEREHVNDDTIGKWLLDEGLDTGEYEVVQQTEKTFTPAMAIYVLQDGQQMRAYSNVASGLQLYTSNLGDMSYINGILETFAETPERIVMMTMGVAPMYDTTGSSSLFYQTFTLVRTGAKHTPRNNKLKCYPYELYALDNYMGSVEQFHWEECNTTSVAEFAIEGSAIPKPSMTCFPINYKGVTADATQRNTLSQFAVTYDNFPEVPWVSDTFKAWVSQYGFSNAVNAGASVGISVVGGVASLATGNVAGAVGSAISGVQKGVDAYQDYKDHKIHSKQMHGSIGSAGLKFAQGEVGFRVTQYAIYADAGERIDAYFDRYGYRVDMCKRPNITGRQYVNYVKCREAHVAGRVPVDARDCLENALMNGVSFWHVNNMNGAMSSNPIV